MLEHTSPLRSIILKPGRLLEATHINLYSYTESELIWTYVSISATRTHTEEVAVILEEMEYREWKKQPLKVLEHREVSQNRVSCHMLGTLLVWEEVFASKGPADAPPWWGAYLEGRDSESEVPQVKVVLKFTFPTLWETNLTTGAQNRLAEHSRQAASQVHSFTGSPLPIQEIRLHIKYSVQYITAFAVSSCSMLAPIAGISSPPPQCKQY